MGDYDRERRNSGGDRGGDRGGRGGGDRDRFDDRPRRAGQLFKMLCPFYVAGAVIGRGGEEIKYIKEKSGCSMKVSRNDERFPTTNERVVSIQGSVDGILESILFVQDKIRADEPPDRSRDDNQRRKEACKLIVSGSAAGRVIGSKGERVQGLKKDHDVSINISRKDDLPSGLDERCVSVEGRDKDVDACVEEIVRVVLEGEDITPMEWNVYYNDFSDRDRGRGGGERGGDRERRDDRSGERGRSPRREERRDRSRSRDRSPRR